MNWSAKPIEDRRKEIGTFLLGTGNFGGIARTIGPGVGLDESDSHALMNRAVGEGIRVLDTADSYALGASEDIVGAWAATHDRAEVFIETKTGISSSGPDLSPGRVRQQLAASIAKLGRVDFFLAHVVDPNTPWEESLPVFSSAVEDGIIRAYGLSNVDEQALTTALEVADRLGLRRPEIVQNSYSLLARGDDYGVLPLVRDEGLIYTPYSPLANGVLSGRYSRDQKPAPTSRAAIASPSQVYLNDPETMAKVREFDELALSESISSAGLALAWLVNHKIVTAPVIGLSSADHWHSIHEAVRLNWTEDFEDRLASIFTR